MDELCARIAKTSLVLGAIKLQPDNPFTWTSGYRMPIYNDNRLLLGHAEHRRLICKAFVSKVQELHLQADAIAGVATAGIPHAVTLADRLELPFLYVRGKPKEHGLGNQVEGFDPRGKQVMVVEDLVSTGKSSFQAIEVVRQAGGKVTHCLCIFSYGFAEAEEVFRNGNVALVPLLTYGEVLEKALTERYIRESEYEVLQEWNRAPLEWGKDMDFQKSSDK